MKDLINVFCAVISLLVTISAQAGPAPDGRWVVSRKTASNGDAVDRLIQEGNDMLANEQWQIEISGEQVVVKEVDVEVNDDGRAKTTLTKMPIVESEFKNGRVYFVTRRTTEDSISGQQAFVEVFVIQFDSDGKTATGQWRNVLGTGPDDPFKMSKRGTISLKRWSKEADDAVGASSLKAETSSKPLTKDQRRARIGVIDAQLVKVRSDIRQQQRSVDFAREHNDKNPGYSSSQMLIAAERLLQTYQSQEARLMRERESLE